MFSAMEILWRGVAGPQPLPIFCWHRRGRGNSFVERFLSSGVFKAAHQNIFGISRIIVTLMLACLVVIYATQVQFIIL